MELVRTPTEIKMKNIRLQKHIISKFYRKSILPDTYLKMRKFNQGQY